MQSACVTPAELSVGRRAETGRILGTDWQVSLGKLVSSGFSECLSQKPETLRKKHLRKTPSVYIYRHTHAHTVMLIYTHIPNAHVKTDLKK